MPLLLPLLGFVFITLLVGAAAMLLSPRGATVIEQRLGEFGGGATVASEPGVGSVRIFGALKKLGNVIPKSPSEMGKLQLRLVAAGYRSREAIATFLGASLFFIAQGAPPSTPRPSTPVAARRPSAAPAPAAAAPAPAAAAPAPAPASVRPVDLPPPAPSQPAPHSEKRGRLYKGFD